MARLFYVHWNKNEALERVRELRSWGHSVAYECKDGAAACQRIRKTGYDAVVVDLRRLPSHGRRVGEHLQEFKSTRDVPVIFVDGAGERLEKARNSVPTAKFTTGRRLKAIVANL